MIVPTVHILDGDACLCFAMTRLLRTYGYDVRTYSSTYQFLSRQLALVPACLVLDLKMPGIGGLKVQEILSNRDGYLPIIFVSSQADVEESVRAMKAGAIDFLMKPFDCDKLLSAIQAALAVSERVLRKKDEFKKDQAAFVTLTRREREVCIRIAQGLLNKQVGFELGTAEKTVKAQRARVMHKLGAGSIVDVVKFVERLRVAGGLPQT